MAKKAANAWAEAGPLFQQPPAAPKGKARPACVPPVLVAGYSRGCPKPPRRKNPAAPAEAMIRGWKRKPEWIRVASWGVVAIWPVRGGHAVKSWLFDGMGERRKLVAARQHGSAAELEGAIAVGRQVRRGTEMRTNGSDRGDLVKKALAARKAWTGHAPKQIVRGEDPATGPAPGGVLFDLGELVTVEYRATKRPDGPEEGIYRHEFGEEGGTPPRLTGDAHGRLRVLGGTYWIAPEGIRD